MKRGRNQRRRQGVNPNRALDSNGPEVRIRGTANQIYDKYVALARDASSSGDRVKAESYLQHAEHYFRVIRSMQPQQSQPHAQANPDGEQPSVGDGEEAREERRSERPRPNGSDSQEKAAQEGEDDRSSSAGGGDEEERRPRRRRGRRQTRRAEGGDGDGDSDSDAPTEEDEAAAAQ